MASPIILCFDRTGSFTSLNTFALSFGGSFGSVTMPFTPLEFTNERIASVCGSGSGYLDGRIPLTNEIFYEETYSGLKSEKKYFWGNTNSVNTHVCGMTVGLSGGKTLSTLSNAFGKTVGPAVAKGMETVEFLFNQKVAPVLTEKITELIKKSKVPIDQLAYKKETSMNATLYGMNGQSTYNHDMYRFNSNSHVLFINISVGVIAQVGLNFVLIGDFPPMPIIPPNGFLKALLNPFDSVGIWYTKYIANFIAYLYAAFNSALAWTIIGDAALGSIPPGASISLIGSYKYYK